MPASRFTLRRRVFFHETDMAGIVHFSNFYKMMEEVEHAFFRSLGTSVHPRPQKGQSEGQTETEMRMGWPRVKASCEFHAPLFFEEEIEIELLVAEIRPRSLRYVILFWKNPDGESDTRIKAASGELTVVRVAADRAKGVMKAVPIPDELREMLAVHEA
jgi:acyl-CoA thioester hydrolase